MISRTTRTVALTTTIAAAAVLSACGSDDDNAGDAQSPAGEIAIGVPAGWDEGVLISNMTAVTLEEQGYEVSLTDGDIGMMFAGVSTGDLDLLMEVALPTLHANYLEAYGDTTEDLGYWYEENISNIAVNADAPIDSIAELAENADLFNNEIIGIDGGAGITRITQEEVIPTYGLEGMDFKISSTAAMLAELDGAMADGRNIAVTLWVPHWAYAAYDIKNLEDPELAFGEPDQLHTFARDGFTADYPDVAEMIGEVHLTEDDLSRAGNYVMNENADRDTYTAVSEWLDDNPEVKERFTVDSDS
ncbi:glycine betaine ABC transporter substrate-binding protein [Flaviflexus salsibiostraticola]|uniref:Glycine betaine ABC transporter substrate-binding protein n=1 Tax=Flaviflexus salsibiostraticola TaxID=1282737 RepID=A0A3S8ZA77_9ACTO|nr:glycine betaine ABC transporter substrate-binding protein [Flaviflexus salsibiostraticola]AZN30375.1 glycine betaine ABC transporter substrate-binding protein [Flaviflexus salsibiostraticola]